MFLEIAHRIKGRFLSKPPLPNTMGGILCWLGLCSYLFEVIVCIVVAASVVKRRLCIHKVR